MSPFEPMSRRLIVDALRKLRGKAKAHSPLCAFTPLQMRPGSCASSSSGLGSALMPPMLDDAGSQCSDEVGDNKEDVEWLPPTESSLQQMKQKRKVQRVSNLSTPTVQTTANSEKGVTRLADVNAVERVASRASQASESASSAGTARMARESGLVGGGPCSRCRLLLMKLKERADVEASRSAAEVARMKASTIQVPRGHSKYNFTKLKRILKQECFDSLGNYTCHSTCIRETFSVSCTIKLHLNGYYALHDRSCMLLKRALWMLPQLLSWRTYMLL